MHTPSKTPKVPVVQTGGETRPPPPDLNPTMPTANPCANHSHHTKKQSKNAKTHHHELHESYASRVMIVSQKSQSGNLNTSTAVSLNGESNKRLQQRGKLKENTIHPHPLTTSSKRHRSLTSPHNDSKKSFTSACDTCIKSLLAQRPRHTKYIHTLSHSQHASNTGKTIQTMIVLPTALPNHLCFPKTVLHKALCQLQ